MPTQTKENYLKSLYFLDKHKSSITITELSKQMGVSPPTANNMIKKLKNLGMVKYERYQPLELTEQGRKLAALIIRKHRLAEMFLTEVMGLGWEEVHDIAEDLEHIQSERFFDRMDEILNYPDIDPHGSPIPDKKGRMTEHDFRPLSEIPAGKTVRLKALRDSSSEFLEFLNSKGIGLGTEIAILSAEAYDDSIKVRYNDHADVMLTNDVSRRLLVEAV
ncbi:MAG: metal-dependent transcriptional regulator [Saprospiraceae bacterium]|nr:metal-dependent transcriptional regulator [Saprospiraceae bacterium]